MFHLTTNNHLTNLQIIEMKRIVLLLLFAVAIIFMAFKKYTPFKSRIAKDSTISSEYFDNAFVVLELFTSQGCSSCPAADILLEKAKLKYPNQVFALSYHVDYWNYIGWKDPFSKHEFTLKQREYNRKFNNNSNYTPQMVVNGRGHFVGSNQHKMNYEINQYLKEKPANQIVLNANKKDRKVYYDYELKGDVKNKEIRVVLVVDERNTPIKSGENRNRVLKNSNVVVNEKYEKILQSNGSGSIEIPPLVKTNEKVTLLMLIQNSNLDITGAAKVKIGF